MFQMETYQRDHDSFRRVGHGTRKDLLRTVPTLRDKTFSLGLAKDHPKHPD